MEDQKEVTWVQENRDYNEEEKFKRKVTLRSILCNRTVKGWMVFTLFSFTIPILIYYFVIDQGTYETSDTYTCLVQNTFRVRCGKVNISASYCNKLDCCFDSSTNTCYHFLPSKYSYNNEDNAFITTQSKTPFGKATIKQLYVSINERDKDTISVILSQDKIDDQKIDTDKNYRVTLMEQSLMIDIHRNNDDLLLSTAKGPLIASDDYWEWSFYLTNQTLFGLNKTLLNIETNDTFTKVLYKSKIDHTTRPILWAYRNKNFHGVVIKHEGPLEIEILPSNLVILRSLTGGSIELELSVGPTPQLLHDQQAPKTEEKLPPLWSLDTLICRKGDNVNLTELAQSYEFDDLASNDCIHENLLMAMMMDNMTNVDAVRDIVTNIKEQGSRLLLHVPPHVMQNSDVYNTLIDLDIFYKYGSRIFTGKYLNQNVSYPYYNHSNIQLFMDEMYTLLNAYLDVNDIDGFVLHDNWPLNEEDFFPLKGNFQYLSKELEAAMSFTLPWNSRPTNGSRHMLNHNSYGATQMSTVQDYFSKTISDVFIMSASKAFSQTQPSVIQNVNVSWTNFALQIDNILFSSITGDHLVSFPVCGDTTFFNEALQETLCLRWYLMAATMPMFRISSHTPFREPKSLNSVFAGNSIQNALSRRQMLLPYYYTILSRNEPVVRPMFYDYYKNETTFSITHQYMIGENILVAYPLSLGRRRLQVYLPSTIGIWYELWAGEMFNSTIDAWTGFDIVESDFVVFISQGHILPLKDGDTLNPIVALNCSNATCQASGSLLLDSSYMTFVSTDTEMTISDIPQSNCNYTLGGVTLYYYKNFDGYRKIYNSNEALCNGDISLTITFESDSLIS